jgi:hypothetical protein
MQQPAPRTNRNITKPTVYSIDLMVYAWGVFRDGHTWEEVAEHIEAKYGTPAPWFHLSERIQTAVREDRLPGCRQMTSEEKAERIERMRVRKGRVYGIKHTDPSGRADPNDAAYWPARDGQPVHTSLTAHLCGDPLPGRSALDQRSRAHG